MSAAEIFIQATETDPDVIARGVVREAHERLRAGLAELQPVAGERSVGISGVGRLLPPGAAPVSGRGRPGSVCSCGRRC